MFKIEITYNDFLKQTTIQKILRTPPFGPHRRNPYKLKITSYIIVGDHMKNQSSCIKLLDLAAIWSQVISTHLKLSQQRKIGDIGPESCCPNLTEVASTLFFKLCLKDTY